MMTDKEKKYIERRQKKRRNKNPYRGKKGINKRFIAADGKQRYLVGCRAERPFRKEHKWSLVVLRCPYCGEQHRHGSPWSSTDEPQIGMKDGGRAPHCGEPVCWRRPYDYFLAVIEVETEAEFQKRLRAVR